MALVGTAYSPHQWKLCFVAESTLGTPNVTSMQYLDIDAPMTLSSNPTMLLDPRSGGSGRVAAIADAFIDDRATYSELSFEAYADATSFPLLVSNITTVGVGSSPAGYLVPFNYTPPSLAFGDTGGTDINTMTVALVDPEGSNSILLPGATLTNLGISMDHEEESGVVKISGTFGTGFLLTYAQAAPTTPTLYSATKYYITQMTTKHTVAGVANAVIKSLNLELHNPSKYIGFQGANGDPEVVARGLDEFEIMLSATLKIDSNAGALRKTFADGTTVANEISDNATWGSATNFGIKAAYGKIMEEPTLNDAGAAYYDVKQKLMASTANDVLEIIC